MMIQQQTEIDVVGGNAQAWQMWRNYFEGTAALQAYLEADLKRQLHLDLGDYNIMLVLWHGWLRQQGFAARRGKNGQNQENKTPESATGSEPDPFACGQIRLGQLAQQVVFSPSRLNYRINRLVEKQLVCRREDPADKRAFLVELTQQGRAVFAQARQVHLELVKRDFLDGLSEEEVRVMDRVFTRVCEQMGLEAD